MDDLAPGREENTDARERIVTRRQYIRGIGRGTAGTVALAAASGTAAAENTVEDFAAAKPNHATISNDTAWLEHYRPFLDLRHVPRDNRPALHGWRVTSTDSERDTDVGVYMTEYAVQKSGISLTSHSGDHEWIYVFVDSQSGDVVDVSYSAYHWLRGYVRSPQVNTDDGGEHPMFLVADTYHNLIPLTERKEGILKDVGSLGDFDSRSGNLYDILKNGMSEDMEPGAVHNPHLLAPDGPLDAWWSEDSARTERLMVDAWAWIGDAAGYSIEGYDDTDTGGADL